MANIARDLRVSFDSVKSWLDVFGRFFMTFRISPWHRKITRAITKEKKLYLFDYASIIVREGRPFLLIEVIQTETSPAKNLLKFQKKMLNIPAIQLVDREGVCKIVSNGDQKVMLVNADHWLSLLP